MQVFKGIEISRQSNAPSVSTAKSARAIFEDAGPSCVELGYCPEGKLRPPTCKIEEIRRTFKEL